MAQISDDCFAFGGELMPSDEALAVLDQRLSPVVAVETVPLRQASGRILAEDVVAECFVPPHDNAAVDGYAVYFDDLNPQAETLLPVTARIAAGHPLDRPPRRGEALLSGIVTGYRNNRTAEQVVAFAHGERTIEVHYRDLGGDRFRVAVDGGEASVGRLVSHDGPALVFEDGDGVRRTVRVATDGAAVYCHGPLGAVRLDVVPRFGEGETETVAGGCLAPMPGKIIQLRVEEGAEVQQGQVLVILEAMKMEHSVTAPADGVVQQVLVSEGEQVDADALLVVVE